MELQLSISSILGTLSGISINEKYYSSLPLTKHVIFYQSNWARGGLCKPTKKSNRRSAYSQGDGSCFNSQITFGISVHSSMHLAYCKIFRNGVVIVTGYRYSTKSVYYKIIKIMLDYMKKYMRRDNCIIADDARLISSKYILRNFKSVYHEPINLFKLSKYFNNLIKKYVKINIHYIIENYDEQCNVTQLVNKACIKKQFILQENLPKLIELLSEFQYQFVNLPVETRIGFNMKDLCKEVINRFIVDFKITIMTYKPESYAGLILKLVNPNGRKDVTIKIFKSGKINFDGNQSRSTADFYKHWLCKHLRRYLKFSEH